MKIKNIQIYGLEQSIIRSGYPMQIGEPLSFYLCVDNDKIGLSALNRSKKLAKAPIGSGHDNFLKGIIVQFDLKYPQYFTPQLQRYHWIDIISSQSKMHSLVKYKDIKYNCNNFVLLPNIDITNQLIEIYNEITIYPYNKYISYQCITFNSKEEVFQYIISNLPMGFELWMGISTNYLQLKTIYNQRKTHKLYDWKGFCEWIETLPYSKELICSKN